jgi:hypothetical protein
MHKRTDKRVSDRKLICSEMRKLRYLEDAKLAKKQTHIHSLCVNLFGDYSQSSRCALTNLEHGSRTVDISMFYKYLKTIGYSDKKIQSEFLRIVSLI